MAPAPPPSAVASSSDARTPTPSGLVAKKTIKVDITSDGICPFCMLGLQNLRKAISCSRTAQLGLEFIIEFHPFLLDPTLGTEPMCKRTRYVQKFGKDRFPVMERVMQDRFKAAGLEVTMNGMISQTTTYHRLLTHAYALGGQDMQLPLVDALNKGYFQEGKDLGDKRYLASQAVAVGVFPSEGEAIEWLSGDDKLEEVQVGYKKAQNLGISGVPFFVFGNKYAISGAQPPEAFFEVFQEIAKGEVLQCNSCTDSTHKGTGTRQGSERATTPKEVPRELVENAREGETVGVKCDSADVVNSRQACTA